MSFWHDHRQESAEPNKLDERISAVLGESRALFLRRLDEIARRAGLVSPPVAAAFTQELGDAYDKLVVSRRDGFEQTDGLTSSKIMLMGDDDLELGIRADAIGRRLAEVGGSALLRVRQRYMALLRRPELMPADNPVGPETIALGLLAICRSSGAGHDDNLILLSSLEEQLVLELPDLYRELNDLLAGCKVAAVPAPLATGGGTPPGPRYSASSQVNAEGGANPLSALQNMLSRQRAGGKAGAVAETPGDRGGPMGDVALNLGKLVVLNQLVARLDRLESSGVPTGLSGTARDGGESMPARAVRAKDFGLPPGNPEAVALDTLALIFEDIFATGELPDAVKATIARLQIPVLKVAIFDPLLFSDAEHPARRLINGIARAAVGLPRNVGRGHPLCARLWRLVGAVCATLHRDCSVLSAPLAELGALIAERDSDISAAAQPYLPLLQEREAGEQASTAARRWLQDIVEERDVAPEIFDFLHRYWVRAMEVACLEEGGAGGLWQEYNEAIVELLWSVQPKRSAEDRKLLVSLVPSLLKRINGGLDRIGVSAGERASFLDACFTLQTAALRGESSPPALPDAALPTDSAPAAKSVVDTLEGDGRQLKTMTLGGLFSADGLGPASAVQAGDWLQFSLDGGEPLCGLVCWLNPQSGSVLLFNPDWSYAVAIAAAVLEQQLRDARAKVVSSRAIFDIAAQRAMNRLAGG